MSIQEDLRVRREKLEVARDLIYNEIHSIEELDIPDDGDAEDFYNNEKATLNDRIEVLEGTIKEGTDLQEFTYTLFHDRYTIDNNVITFMGNETFPNITFHVYFKDSEITESIFNIKIGGMTITYEYDAERYCYVEVNREGEFKHPLMSQFLPLDDGTDRGDSGTMECPNCKKIISISATACPQCSSKILTINPSSFSEATNDRTKISSIQKSFPFGSQSIDVLFQGWFDNGDLILRNNEIMMDDEKYRSGITFNKMVTGVKIYNFDEVSFSLYHRKPSNGRFTMINPYGKEEVLLHTDDDFRTSWEHANYLLIQTKKEEVRIKRIVIAFIN